MRTPSITLTVLLLSAVAAATPVPLEATADRAQEAKAALDAATAPEALPADGDPWALYEEAFAAASSGRDSEAMAVIGRLRMRHAGSGAAVLSFELERYIAGRQTGVLMAQNAELRERLSSAPTAAAPMRSPPAFTPATPGRTYASLGEALRDESPTTQARAELVLFQTIQGIAAFNELCYVIGCYGPWTIGANMAGAGLGLWGSLAFTSGGITQGHAQAINSGTLWGAWHGILLAGMTQVSAPVGTMMALGGQALGTVGGHYAWQALNLGSGDVGLINSAGIWTTAAMALSWFTLSPGSPNPTIFLGALLAASDLGLVGGAWLSRYMPIGRGRALVIDAGGILGGLTGAAIYALIVPNNFSGWERGLAGTALVGVVAGLGTAGWLTRDWDVAAYPIQVGVLPTNGGAQLVVSSSL